MDSNHRPDGKQPLTLPLSYRGIELKTLPAKPVPGPAASPHRGRRINLDAQKQPNPQRIRPPGRKLAVLLPLSGGACTMLMNDRLTEPCAASADSTILTDIAIVGGGLAGSLAAAVLARAGHRVVLIDKREVYPEEFRVEKLAGQQLDILRRLGFIDELAAAACHYGRVLNIRDGKVVDISVGEAYGLSYHRLVAMARALIPAASSFIVDQVTGLRCSSDLQQLSLASGKRIS